MLRLLLVALVGCTPLYDAQLDDRATALEASRTEFLPGSDKVQFVTASESKLYWVNLEGALEVPTLHSFSPSTGARVDFAIANTDTRWAMDYKMSDDLVVRCSFGTTIAYDARVPNLQLGMTANGNDLCTVDGPNVYFSVGREIRKWTPSSGQPAKMVLSIDTALGPTAGSVDGLAVIGDQGVLDESSRLWLMNLVAGTAAYLNNDGTTGKVNLDTRGVMFDSQKGVEYIQFADKSMLPMTAAIADGGYSLNFKHGDVQTLADGGGYTLFAGHAIYRGEGGIFAYGFDTTKVIDLLLDRGMGYEALPHYGDPLVTSDGTLFVQDITQASSASPHPVYRVDLSGRLR